MCQNFLSESLDVSAFAQENFSKYAYIIDSYNSGLLPLYSEKSIFLKDSG